jgi:hypothetical protein
MPIKVYSSRPNWPRFISYALSTLIPKATRSKLIRLADITQALENLRKRRIIEANLRPLDPRRLTSATLITISNLTIPS